MISKMRSEFEEWAEHHLYLPLVRTDHGYTEEPVECAWLAWQASRAALSACQKGSEA